jgi:hypothetical protein
MLPFALGVVVGACAMFAPARSVRVIALPVACFAVGAVEFA